MKVREMNSLIWIPIGYRGREGNGGKRIGRRNPFTFLTKQILLSFERLERKTP